MNVANFAFTHEDRIALERCVAEDLREFVKLAWPVIDPEPYVHGWHMDAICDHLEAVSRGDIKRLIINVPPGTSKSTAVAVMWGAWLWGPGKWPECRIVGGSYEQSLAVRDARKMRMLVESDWYQARWPLKMASDQNEKLSFENEKRGFREAKPVKSFTGRRGNIVFWDDPLSASQANSDTDRPEANRVHDETLPTRFNNPKQPAFVLIMQRLHEDDVTGHALEKDMGYEHLMLPMEFDPERKCHTSIGFEDPRTEIGELLMPDRFDEEVVEDLKKALGDYASAGQLDQLPVPRDGALFRPDLIELIDEAEVPKGTRWVRGWDLAATERKKNPNAARTAGVKIGLTPKGEVIFGHSTADQLAPDKAKQLIVTTAKNDTRTVKISIPQDPGQAGVAQKLDFARALNGYPVSFSPESGDKITRAEPLAAQVSAGNAKMIRGPWNADLIGELRMFPGGKFADQVDASSRAYAELLKRGSTTLQGTQE